MPYIITTMAREKKLYVSNYAIRRFDGTVLVDYAACDLYAERFLTVSDAERLINRMHNPFTRDFSIEHISGEQIMRAVATEEEHFMLS